MGSVYHFIKGYFDAFVGIKTRKNHPKIEAVLIVSSLFFN